MLLTLISVLIALVGFFLIKLDKSDILEIGGIIMLSIGGVITLFCLIIIITCYACAPNEIMINKLRYEGLIKRVESINSHYEDVSKSDVIKDVTEWNMEVTNTKYWTYNPWTSWFYPDEVADNMEYIQLEE